MRSLNVISCEQWFALRVKARQEWRIRETLERKGYELFFPTREAKNGEAGAPLFPGYLFCRVDPRFRLPILITPGVISFVGHGKTPIPIDEEELEQVRKIVDSGLRRESIPVVTAGDRVCVMDGVLQGLEGILVREKSEWRVVVSIFLLQRSVAVDIDRESLRLVGRLAGQEVRVKTA
jgi:transcription antitermination factor NusG